MPRFCSTCGAQMADNAAFCPACGKSTAAAGEVGAGGPATAPAYSTTTTSTSGLNDNVAGLLAYLFIPAIIFLVVEPYNKNKFIRFHSFQGIFFGVGWIVLQIIMGIVWAVPILGWAIGFVVWLGMVITWIVLMIKAFQGTMFKLPIIGDMAEKQANQQ